MAIEGIEAAHNVAKQATDLSGMTTTRLPYTDYYPTIRKATNSE